MNVFWDTLHKKEDIYVRPRPRLHQSQSKVQRSFFSFQFIWINLYRHLIVSWKTMLRWCKCLEGSGECRVWFVLVMILSLRLQTWYSQLTAHLSPHLTSESFIFSYKTTTTTRQDVGHWHVVVVKKWNAAVTPTAAPPADHLAAVRVENKSTLQQWVSVNMRQWPHAVTR